MAPRIYDERIAHHPHDGLTKRIFTNPEAAAAELRHVLPVAFTSHLEMSTLRVEPTSFVDPELHARTSDILYSVELAGSGRPVSVYVVLEHQSSPDPTMPARFVVYVGRLYERYLDEHAATKTVPLVVPVLLYQGPTGWTLPRRLSEMIDAPPELLENFPSPIELHFAVDDLSESALGEQVNKDQLARDRGLALAEMARTMLWLHHHRDAADGERAATLGRLTAVITSAWGKRAVEPFMTYFIATFGPASKLRATLLESASPETQHMFTTIREQLLAEGMAKGKAAGIVEGRAEGLAQALESLLSSRGIELTADARLRLVSCGDPVVLQRWFDRAIRASSLAEVFED